MTERMLEDGADRGVVLDTTRRVANAHVGIGRRLLERLLAGYGPRDFTIRFWDGTELPANSADGSAFTLELRHAGALRAMLGRPIERSLAEAYIDERVDVHGDLFAAFPLADFMANAEIPRLERVRMAAGLLALPAGARAGTRAAVLHGSPGSIDRTRAAVRFHYDQPAEFWQLWLDPALVYSGAFFERPTDSLEAAQRAKLDKVCTKLQLAPGHTLLDIGCGWGGLIIHAATHYDVRAHGITLSQKQADFALQRIQELGLGDRCTVEVRDFRQFDANGEYDGVASVGAIEHVPERDLPAYFQCAWHALRPGGRFLSQGITRAAHMANRPRSAFMLAYVFPDSSLMTLDRTLAVAERQGFETRHVEAMREHYARTTRLWFERLSARADEAIRMVGRPTYRTFGLMLAGSSYHFTRGTMGLYQVLLMRGT